ncbi:MAG: HAMP domain-containing sensor histidine kinase, partial [Actinomycetaceae bacterium]|nr:HAMP domain-containing sensor histidine kinase [Actinomycetaceae bacterium]
RTMLTTTMTTMTRFRLRSLRGSITIWVTFLAAVGILNVGLVAGIVGVEEIRDRVDQSLAREVSQFKELASRHQHATVPALMEKALQQNVPEEHEVFAVYFPDATWTQAGVDRKPLSDPKFRDAVMAGTHAQYLTFRSKELGEMRCATVPTSGLDEDGNEVTAYFLAGYRVDQEVSEMREVAIIFALASIPALLGVAGVAWLVSSRVLAPLRQLRETANRISGTDVSQRIEVHGDDELAQLTGTFNSMLDRLEEALGAQRDMLDDVGHELRTPITVVRGHLELMDATDPEDVDSVREISMDELDRMNLLVGDMITLAKSRRPDFLHLTTVNLVEVVTDVLDRGEVLGKDTKLTAQELGEVWVEGDRNRLVQAMMQLVENALAVSAAGEPISLGCKREGPRALMWVRDSGPGVPPHLREAIFDRHVRGTDLYEGTGLGLAIVSAVARAHGGSAYVGQSDASGSQMVIEIPAATMATIEAETR